MNETIRRPKILTKQIGIRVRPETWKYLDGRANQNGSTPSRLIRIAIEEFVAREKIQEKKMNAHELNQYKKDGRGKLKRG
jgi:predicted transcriptional regulator